MDFVKLKYFHIVAKLQHVTKAAEELHISQPSLTQALHLLERDLGVKLFVKQGRNIVLSDYGKFLKERLDFLLPEIYSIKQDINILKKEYNKTIRLNILASSSFIIENIIKFRKIYPDAIFDFEQTNLNANCDIVIATNGIDTSKLNGLQERVVIEEKIFLAVPNNSKYKGMSQIDLIDVKEEKFIMLSSSRLFGAICKNLCSKAGFNPKILFESDSPSAVQNIIRIGAGVAFWPEISWGKIENNSIKLLSISSPSCKRDLIIQLHNINDKLNNSKYVKLFYQFVLEQIKNYKS